MQIREAIDMLDQSTKESMCSALMNGDVSVCRVSETQYYLSVIDYDTEMYIEVENVNHWHLLEKKEQP